jgi:hypothetical protein
VEKLQVEYFKCLSSEEKKALLHESGKILALKAEIRKQQRHSTKRFALTLRNKDGEMKCR